MKYRVQDAEEGGVDVLVWFTQELGGSVVSDKLEEPTELQTLSLTVSRYGKLFGFPQTLNATKNHRRTI